MTTELSADATPYGLPIIYAPRGLLTDNAENRRGREPKAAEVTASRIIDDIIANRVEVGEKLPTEPVMLERYPVSRETLREALRLLEMQGIIDIKRGPGGGPTVAPLNSGYLARTTSLYLHLAGATQAELFTVWELLESAAGELVANMPDRRRKREIFEPFINYDPDAHQDSELFDDFNNFHAVIAALSKNRVLTLVTQAVTHIVVESVLKSVDPVAERSMLSHSHVEIAQAIVDGRGARTRKLMTEHIREVAGTFMERDPLQGRAVIEWRL